MRKVGLLALGCLVWIVGVFVLLIVVGLFLGRGRTGQYANQAQVIGVICVGAYIYYAIHILRS